MHPARPDRRPLRFRQIHLDFHTSEHIPDVGADFDEGQFIDTLRLGHVDSVTVFAQCHHGWSYYPSDLGITHPSLKTDLLGRMLAACREADIATRVYITVGWNDRAAREHPEWISRRPDGAEFGPERRPADAPRPECTWYYMCLGSPYLETVHAVIREVIAKYRPEGFFFDITFRHRCICPSCTAGMRTTGLDPQSPGDQLTYAHRVYTNYLRSTGELVWSELPHAAIYHNNAGVFIERPDWFQYFSHYEIESLPTGFWGYHHFPTNAAYLLNREEVDRLGMTGKFHTEWGEFGGYKNADALRYECARMAAWGCKASVGDQLHPSGRMNPDSYRRIAPGYAELAAREPWLGGVRPVGEVGILSPRAFVASADAEASERGAAAVLVESQTPFMTLDAEMDFSGLRLLILPDEVPVSERLAARLNRFVQDGGALLMTGHSGLDPAGEAFALDFGLDYEGPSEWDRAYIQLRDRLTPGLVAEPFLVYETGIRTRVRDAQVLADSVRPFFNRTMARFCGHRNAPDAGPAGWPAVARKGRMLHVADPLFRVYQRHGMPLHRDVLRALMRLLLPEPLLDVRMPSCGQVTLLRQPAEGDRFVLHLIYATPIPRGHVQVIEDIVPLFDIPVSLRCERAPARVYRAPEREPVAFSHTNGRLRFVVPRLELWQVVCIEWA